MRQEQEHIDRLANALETLVNALGTYELNKYQLSRLESYVNQIEGLAEEIEELDRQTS